MTMPLMNIEDPDSGPVTRIALFDLGFRPFFLFAGITALLLVPLWIHAYRLGGIEPGYYPAMVAWHSHEMIFGYTVAVIAGFLLTAVRNWTGIQTPGGTALASLVMLWLAGRLLQFFTGTAPHWIIAAVDTAFLPVLAVTLAVPLLRRRQKHNLVFLLILAALTVANALVHLQLLGLTQATASRGTSFAIYLIVLLIAILGGRVIPFFTEKGIAGAATRQWEPVEYLSLGALPALMVLDLLDAAPLAVIIAAGLAAAGHGARLFGWYQRSIWSVPLLWVLHLGYAWLVAGFILKALSAAGLINPLLAIHAFTSGGIGTITLGMMARVALGHTGRTLHVAPAMTWAFILANLAGLARVFLPVIAPANYGAWLFLAGLFWSGAFALFLISYTRILIRPRVDGLPG
ncbi:MAG: NnrS family protein [Gammaproteobacteria bacterium]|jgi:uncharacterized protein involved in response to NO